MARPGFWDQPESARIVITELKALKGIVEPVQGLDKRLGDVHAMIELLDQTEDAELRREFDREVEQLSGEVNRVELLSLLSGPNDARDCYFNIQAGVGGADACDWAAMMLRMYLRYCERRGWSVEELSIREGEEAGIQSVNLLVHGPYAYGYLSCEMGVHRMERISPFNAQGKRQTSFASVDVQPEVEDINIEVDWEKEIREDTYRAGGKGGQHVNKTDSAVRLTHLPTGLVVQCQNERSQHKNRASAQKMLVARLYQMEQAKRDAELAKIYEGKGQIGWGYRIRTYTLQPYTLVKDERTGHKEGDVQSVLDGELQGFIDAELRRRAAKRS
jgi:peptide chain release factor 2